MFNRKEAKKRAKINVKKHYVIFVLLCLVAAFLGSEYSSSLSMVMATNTDKVVETASDVIHDTTTNRITADEVFSKVIQGDIKGGSEIAEKINESAKAIKIGGLEIGRARGVFSSLVNSLSSGQIFITAFQAILSVIESPSAATTIFIVLAALIMLAVTIFLKDFFKVAFRRSFLEGYKYDEVKISSLTFLFRMKKMIKASLTIFVTSVYQVLWSLTIVGGIIKKYSYFLVPYIVAENPDIDTNKAITLSRKIMDGHKMECFKLELTFIGWWLLGTCTFGLSEMLFTNPYKEATMVEYYVYLRDLAKKNNIENAELLNDQYLYEYASDELLQTTYADVVSIMTDDIELKDCMHTGLRGFVENFFGIIYKNDESELKYNVAIEQEEKIDQYKHVLTKEQYPERLNLGYLDAGNTRLEETHYLRRYSFWSVVVLFFTFCFIGWSWEVMLHLVEDGVFVNRGTCYGPWLPIYGSGGVMILLLLNKFRRNVGLEAVSAIVLCGVVEYFTHWFLEITKGTKWWDYSGYFLNINGRICAEGLLVFMLGGLAIVYILAPQIDNLVKKANKKVLIPICCILLVAFCCDAVYSSKHPNMGEGITDYDDVVEVVDTNNIC